MDLATLKEYAERARRLAKPADPSTKTLLKDVFWIWPGSDAQTETIQQRAQKSQ
jgi:hypothetical protein